MMMREGDEASSFAELSRKNSGQKRTGFSGHFVWREAQKPMDTVDFTTKTAPFFFVAIAKAVSSKDVVSNRPSASS